MRVSIILIGLGLVLGFATSVWAKGPPKCYSDKMKAAGKYSFCRLKAQSKIPPLAGQAADYTKCDSQYSKKWQKVESRAGCLTEGDEAAIQAKMIGDADTIVARLSGVRFADNGDGTITDNQTGLMWEQKDDSGGIHDKDDTYTWTASFTDPDGTAFVDFLGTLNNCVDDGTLPPTGVTGGFAGYCDWRLPTIVELQTILAGSFGSCTSPCIDLIFGPTATPGYWSSTTFAFGPDNAWCVDFTSALVLNGAKLDFFPVRAVRGGP